MTRAERRHNTEKIIQKRKNILGGNWNPKYNDEPHRLSKMNGVNCGNPKCLFCSNPRKLWNEKTIHEKSFHQKNLIDYDI